MNNKGCKDTQMAPVTRIPIFFAADDKYFKYLSVALASLSECASDEYEYDIRILSSGFSEEHLEAVRAQVKPNIKVYLCNVEKRIGRFKNSLAKRLRDYYSESIYYRLFIPSLFPSLKRALYLDSDIVLRRDPADLYFTDIGDALVGAVTDESVVGVPEFCDYVKRHVGIRSEFEYFNSGVLVMNLTGIREEKIEEKFLYMLEKNNFNTVAPDQDYLNFLCRGRVHYLERGWNKHAIDGTSIAENELYLMHYNMFNKPWHYDNVLLEEHFWNAARKTPFYDDLLRERAHYTDEQKAADIEAARKLVMSTCEICNTAESMDKTVGADYFEQMVIV